jgi:hypothetical protein
MTQKFEAKFLQILETETQTEVKIQNFLVNDAHLKSYTSIDFNSFRTEMHKKFNKNSIKRKKIHAAFNLTAFLIILEV